MDFKSHALSLAEFLNDTSRMWREEIMNEYPSSLQDYPKEWIDLLDSLSEKELFDIDCKRNVSKIEGSSFHEFILKINSLTQLPFIPKYSELPLENWAFHGVKKKKKHEIQRIVPVLKLVKDQLNFKRVVDIGGGVGHLSRVLSHYHQIPSVSIDQNSEFQAVGKERLKKFRKLSGAQDVEFLNATLKFDDPEDVLRNVINTDAMILGLHTCGSLAHTLIQSTIHFKSPALLSFGCCYYKMNPEVDLPLSQFYKIQTHFPRLNLYGLTLATRSHAPMSFETYQTKERVKNYRNALHLFLLKHYQNKYFTSVGECHISTYWKPFHHYIEDKLRELKIAHTFSDLDFDQFYHSLETQSELRKMYLANIIRWQLGRALEIYLQIDRCLFLEENHYKAELKQYFDEEISPRNLGILAIQDKQPIINTLT